jgi:hypothetical protein
MNNIPSNEKHFVLYDFEMERPAKKLIVSGVCKLHFIATLFNVRMMNECPFGKFLGLTYGVHFINSMNNRIDFMNWNGIKFPIIVNLYVLDEHNDLLHGAVCFKSNIISRDAHEWNCHLSRTVKWTRETLALYLWTCEYVIRTCV